jgi:ESS family glutamate:Na+ symporter
VTTLGLKLPDFVTCLLAGIILTNTVPLLLKRFPLPVNTPSLALISDVSLGLFLSMSLMSLQLWTLIDLAEPIAILLLVQFSLSIIYTVLLVFPLMGKKLSCFSRLRRLFGFKLRATLQRFANMTAVTEHFGASPQAFIIVPLVGAFFY